MGLCFCGTAVNVIVSGAIDHSVFPNSVMMVNTDCEEKGRRPDK